MENSKKIAVANIVSAIISKDSSCTGYAYRMEDNAGRYSGHESSKTYGIDIFFNEKNEVILSDNAAGESIDIKLEELILHVSKCLDKVE